ncbi:hypothetical protein GF385_02645 [Candidatus Dependentiae bacterium]|nr:hypothetical protein [Candidatus Dependentiae bacterium]
MRFLKFYLCLLILSFNNFILEGSRSMIIAHRGASGYAAENSKSSFKKAIEFDVEMVEFDVHKCKSNDIIVMHDTTLDRTTNGRGLISEKTLDELKSLRLKDGSQILTLSEVLDVLNPKSSVVLDIKEEGIASQLASTINDYVENKNWNKEQFFATGFQHNELKLLKDLCPFIKLMPSAIFTPYKFAKVAKEMGAYGVCLINIENCFSESLAKDIKDEGLKLWAWTPDESIQAIKRLKKFDVDAIMVDFPDDLKKIFAEIAKQDEIKRQKRLQC